MITTQKVIGVLRKAGAPISTYARSGSIRGWGTSSRGYRVHKRTEYIHVRFDSGTYNANEDDTKMIAKAATILRAAGLLVEERTTDYSKWLEVRDAAPEKAAN